MLIDIRARIRSIGEATQRTDEKKRCIRKVRCQGCGEWINSDDDLSDVEYVKTKRGSEWFFHRGCRYSVWHQKIL